MINKYSDWIIKWRHLIVIAGVAITFVLTVGGKNLVFTNDYRYFLVKIILN